jgi:hypothetical protein
MRVLWKSDLGQGKHDPLEIVAVETKTGSRISADLVVPLDPAQAGPVSLAPDNIVAENAGLLEVIDAQLAAIDELSADIKAAGRSGADYDRMGQKLRDLEEWGATVQDLVGDLSIALGFARDPTMRTGIAELDALLGAVR